MAITNQIFLKWAQLSIAEYVKLYPEVEENPNTPPRKGIPPGKQYPFSLSKYEAAVYNVLYGYSMRSFLPCEVETRKYKIADILNTIPHPPSKGHLRVWRTEKRFKTTVQELKQRFAGYIAFEFFRLGPTTRESATLAGG